MVHLSNLHLACPPPIQRYDLVPHKHGDMWVGGRAEVERRSVFR